MAYCRHKNAVEISDGAKTPAWCPDFGALFVYFERERGGISKRPRWLLPELAKITSRFSPVPRTAKP